QKKMWAASRETPFTNILKSFERGAGVLRTCEEARESLRAREGQADAAFEIAVQRFRLDPESAALEVFSRFLDEWLRKPTTEERSLRELMDYLEYFPQAGGALAMDEGAPEPPPDVVRLMTVHVAKGLEFEHVFVLRAAQQSFPTGYRQPLFE